MKISKVKGKDSYRGYVRKPDGGYKQIYGKTKKEVREKAESLSFDIKTGKFVENNKISFEDWCNEWVDNYLINVSLLTKRTYKKHMKNHIIKEFKNVKLQNLTHNQVQRFIQKLSQNYAPKTVRNIYLVLHRSLSDAVKNGFISFNPSDDIILPKLVKEEIKVLELDEIDTFINLAYELVPEYADCLEFLLFTGLRISEFIGLTIDNYNSDTKTLTVNKQYDRVDRVYIPPKYGATREFRLSESAVKIVENRIGKINKRREKFPNYNDENILFLNPESERITQQTLRKKLKIVTAKLGKEDFRLHDLRHTFATLTIASGTEIKTLQKILGHTDASFTMNVYAHSTEIMNKIAAENLENFRKNSYRIVIGD